MHIFRYFCKEILSAFIALTVIILLIFLSNQFVQYLSRAASGQLPGLVVLQLMALEVPNLLCLLLPLGFYVSILLAYGRLYAENEMIVLFAAGFSQKRLACYTFAIAIMVAVLVSYLVFFVNPGIYHGRAKLIRNQGVATLIKTIVPERFRSIAGGKQVFYVKEMTRSHSQAKDIFFAEQVPGAKHNEYKVLWAASGKTEYDNKKNQTNLVLKDGLLYEGKPGQADYKTYQFGKLVAPMPTPNIIVSDDVRTLSNKQLLPFDNKNLDLVAELQWRISIPIMVLSLTFLALPLSKVNARQGKYARLIPALIIYILYANLMFMGRDWIVQGNIPWWLGLWWLHGLVFLLALTIMYWQKKRL